MTIRRFAAAELTRFLVALDDALAAPIEIVVIGGSALVLGYGVGATHDIDTYQSPVDALRDAAAFAREVTKLEIPLGNSTIAQLPSGHERRLLRVLPELETLTVWVLDRHDLAASKLLRGNEHDRQQLEELHRAVQLDLAILVARFRELLLDYVGDPTEPRWSLFFFVRDQWGEIAALDVEPAVASKS